MTQREGAPVHEPVLLLALAAAVLIWGLTLPRDPRPRK